MGGTQVPQTAPAPPNPARVLLRNGADPGAHFPITFSYREQKRVK